MLRFYPKEFKDRHEALYSFGTIFKSAITSDMTFQTDMDDKISDMP